VIILVSWFTLQLLHTCQYDSIGLKTSYRRNLFYYLYIHMYVYNATIT